MPPSKSPLSCFMFKYEVSVESLSYNANMSIVLEYASMNDDSLVNMSPIVSIAMLLLAFI